MHSEPVRRETPAAPALFLRLAAVETPSSTLIVGRKCFESMGQRRIEGQRRHAKRHAPGGPQMRREDSVNPAPDFFRGAGPHVSASRGLMIVRLNIDRIVGMTPKKEPRQHWLCCRGSSVEPRRCRYAFNSRNCGGDRLCLGRRNSCSGAKACSRCQTTLGLGWSSYRSALPACRSNSPESRCSSCGTQCCPLACASMTSHTPGCG